MSIRVRRPLTDRLELSEGDSITVKRDLTAGEYRDLMRASTRPLQVTPSEVGAATTAKMEIDPIAAGLATVIAYLLDWTFLGADGQKLVIADQPPDVVRALLANIDSDAYMEVQRAVLDHQSRRAADVAEEKKTRSGETSSAATLASVG